MLSDRIDYYHADLTGPFEDTSFPQRKIYLEVLPKIVTAIAPNVTYWCNSPWKGKTANDLTFGDIHQWNGKPPFLPSPVSLFDPTLNSN